MGFDGSDLSVVLPVRIEHRDRQENLETVLRYFARFFAASQIVVVESDAEPCLERLGVAQNGVYRFLAGAHDGHLHKTKLLNLGARLAERPLVAFYDTDVLFRPEAIQAVLQGLRNRTSLAFGIPYNGVQLDVRGPDKARLCRDFDFSIFPCLETAALHANYGHDAVCWNPEGVGGATFFKRQVYLDAGGYNERFMGCYWEDYEIVARFTIMGYPPFRISDANLYHLYHERTNLGQQDPLWYANEAEYNRVLAMSPDELRTYIQTELLPLPGLSGPLPE